MNEAKKQPQVEGSVGLTWRTRAHDRWECRWQARTDIVERGWRPKTIRLWLGTEAELSPAIRQYLVDRSNTYQDEMLLWSRGFAPQTEAAPGEVTTWGELVIAYQTDPASKFVKPGGLRYHTRKHYRVLCGKITAMCGDELIAKTGARDFDRWHQAWFHNPDGPPRVTAAHSTITMLRIISNFGATYLANDACKAASDLLSRMTFQSPKPRESFLEVDQVIGIRKAAHELGWRSIALAQALQFEGIFRQKDIIGEFVPISEPGISDVLDGNNKWLRGIIWEEIDDNLVLSHVTSKRQKLVTVPLLDAPMVVEELLIAYPGCITEERRIDPDTRQERVVLVVHREMLPARGPVIRGEHRGAPWEKDRFRVHWRKCANLAGVPKTVKNMDSRAGAITEATEAGAHIEHVKHAAGHSQTSTTEGYARNQAKKGANVLSIRAGSRQNKNGT